MTSVPEERPQDQTGQGGQAAWGGPTAGGPAVQFARGVHTEMLAANQNLINRAQVLLSLSGVVLGVIGAGLTGSVNDLRQVVSMFEWWMWALLSAAGIALIASIGCCASAMISTHWRRVKPLRQKPTPLDPEHMWFFKDVAGHASNPQCFLARGAQLHEADEVRARLRQALNMAPNVRSRARWVNAGFAFLAGALVLFALTAASYLARVAT